MRTLGAIFVVATLGSAARAQTHWEGVEVRSNAYRMEALNNTVAVSRQAIEQARIRQQQEEWRRYLQRLDQQSRHGEELARQWERLVRRGRIDVDVRTRSELGRQRAMRPGFFATRARPFQVVTRRSLILRRTQFDARLQPTPKAQLPRRRAVRPLTPRQMGRLPRAEGDVWIGTPWTRIKLIPPPGG